MGFIVDPPQPPAHQMASDRDQLLRAVLRGAEDALHDRTAKQREVMDAPTRRPPAALIAQRAEYKHIVPHLQVAQRQQANESQAGMVFDLSDAGARYAALGPVPV